MRAAVDLARLWRNNGKRDEARELLAPIYGRSTERTHQQRARIIGVLAENRGVLFRAAQRTLYSACRRLRVNGLTSVGPRPASTALAHSRLTRT